MEGITLKMKNETTYFQVENKQEIWDGIEAFRDKYADSKLAVITLKNFDWFYDQFGPRQTQLVREAVEEIFNDMSGLKALSYRDFGRWLIGYVEGKDLKAKERIDSLRFPANGLEPKVVPFQDGDEVHVDPTTVSAVLEYHQVDSIDQLFRKE